MASVDGVIARPEPKPRASRPPRMDRQPPSTETNSAIRSRPTPVSATPMARVQRTSICVANLGAAPEATVAPRPTARLIRVTGAVQPRSGPSCRTTSTGLRLRRRCSVRLCGPAVSLRCRTRRTSSTTAGREAIRDEHQHSGRASRVPPGRPWSTRLSEGENGRAHRAGLAPGSAGRISAGTVYSVERLSDWFGPPTDRGRQEAALPQGGQVAADEDAGVDAVVAGAEQQHGQAGTCEFQRAVPEGAVGITLGRHGAGLFGDQRAGQRGGRVGAGPDAGEPGLSGGQRLLGGIGGQRQVGEQGTQFPGGAAQSRGHRGVVLAAASPRYRPPPLPLCPLHLVHTGSVKKLLDALCASDEIEPHVAVWIGAHGVHSGVGKTVVMERS